MSPTPPGTAGGDRTQAEVLEVIVAFMVAGAALVLVGLGVVWIRGGGLGRYWAPQAQVRPRLEREVRRAVAGQTVDFARAQADAKAIDRLRGVSTVVVDRSSDGQEVAIAAMVHVPAAWLPLQDHVCLLAVGRLGVADVAVVDYPTGWSGPCKDAAQLAMHPKEGTATSWLVTSAIGDARRAAARERVATDWEELRQMLNSIAGRLAPPYEIARFREVLAASALPGGWDVGIALQDGQAGIAFKWSDQAEDDNSIYCVRAWFGPQGQTQAWRNGPSEDCTAASVFARAPSSTA